MDYLRSVFKLVLFLGRPEVPGNLRLTPSGVQSRPTLLEWDRPTNIPQDVVVNYMVVINSTTSELESGGLLSDEIQFSIQGLEMQLVNSEDCEPFTFHVVASVPLAEDSMPAIIVDTIPLCKLLVHVSCVLFEFVIYSHQC